MLVKEKSRRHQLTPEQRERLSEALLTIDDKKIEDRIIVFLLADKGYNRKVINEVLGYSSIFAHWWLKRANPDDLSSFQTRLNQFSRPCQPYKFTPENRRILLEIVKKSPSEYGVNKKRWTLKTLANQFTQKTGVAISVSHTCKVLADENIRLKGAIKC